MPLCCLHDALQIALGWTNSHLHQFERDGHIWSDPEWYEDDEIDVTDESLTPLNRVLVVEGDRLNYQYDFGDDWQHKIVLERLVEGDVSHPVCTAGERSCPPEDVGGINGYSEFLQVVFDPKHEEFEHYHQWAGAKFSPEAFDIKKANTALLRKRWPNTRRRR
jgi:hypothetical protein